MFYNHHIFGVQNRESFSYLTTHVRPHKPKYMHLHERIKFLLTNVIFELNLILKNSTFRWYGILLFERVLICKGKFDYKRHLYLMENLTIRASHLEQRWRGTQKWYIFVLFYFLTNYNLLKCAPTNIQF